MMLNGLCCLIYLYLFISSCYAAQDLSKVWLAPGFTLEVYATGLQSARSITQSGYDPWLTYYGSLVNQVYAILDDGSGNPANRKVYVAIDGFSFWPQFDPIGSVGVVWHKGSLYCAEDHQIYRFDNIDNKITQFPLHKSQADFASPYFDHWTSTYQPGFLHNWKTALAIKDDRLYLVNASPCNNCLQPDFGKIISIDLATLSQEREECAGVRSCVGMDFSPKTGQLWFGENGRDAWTLPWDFTAQYRRPADELNVITRPGLHFGFPFCYGDGKTFESGQNDPDFFTGDCLNSPYTPSAWDFHAHSVPLGIQFLAPNHWPSYFQGSIVVAQHGCYICPNKDFGYAVSAVELDATGTVAINDHPIAIFRHFPADGTFEGRPVDVQNFPDGSILVSDDTFHMIYKITYTAPTAAPTTAVPTTAAPTTAAPTTVAPTTAAPTTAAPTTAAPTTATPTTATPTTTAGPTTAAPITATPPTATPPTAEPTAEPTAVPTALPTALPTTDPSTIPSTPTIDPSNNPNNGYQGIVGQTAGSFRLGVPHTTSSVTPSRYQRKKRRTMQSQ